MPFGDMSTLYHNIITNLKNQEKNGKKLIFNIENAIPEIKEPYF
jgi:hypothetical protein